MAAIEHSEVKPFQKFPGVLVKLHVDKRIQPVQITYYRVPLEVEPLLNTSTKAKS